MTHYDRRFSDRAQHKSALFIETINEDQICSFDCNFSMGETIDVSTNGLRVILDFAVMVNSSIGLWITSEDQQHKVLVSGRVRWVSMIDEERFLAGIELNEDSIKKMKKWKQAAGIDTKKAVEAKAPDKKGKRKAKA